MTRLKRVVAVLPQPAFGGLHQLICSLDEPLRERGFELLPVVPADAPGVTEGFADAGVRSVVVAMCRPRRPSELVANLRYLRWEARGFFDLASRVRSERPALVQGFGAVHLVAPRLAAMLGVPLVLELNSTNLPKGLALQAKMLVRFARGLLVEGSAVVERFDLAGREHSIFYPPVSDHVVWFDAFRREVGRAQLGVCPEDFVVCTWSNFTPQKGLDLLVRYILQDRDVLDQVVVVIAGRQVAGHEHYMERAVVGPLRAAGLLGGRVKIIDGVWDRVTALSTADGLVLPSRFEGVATATAEAMRCGRPVVAHDVGSVSDLVLDGSTGFLVPYGDGRSFTDRVGRYASDPTLAQRHGSRGSSRVGILCDVDRIADVHADVYRKALGHV